MKVLRPSAVPRRTALAISTALLAGAAACGDESVSSFGGGPDVQCSIPQNQILAGQRRDGIPALTNPELAFNGEPGTEYLEEHDRVIGLVFEGQPIAIPLNIGWWHEVVNLDGEHSAIAVTHCPLTGSSLAFDRAAVNDAEFGVSGLLFQTNLIMYDRNTSQSLWPQMMRGARCGPADGTQLTMIPIVETNWAGWQRLHPDTKVVTSNTGYFRDYRAYPYGDYDLAQNADLLFPINGPMDSRRPPKERVLGIPDGEGGIAFPFGELDELGPVAAVSGATSQGSFVVFWEREREGAMAFRPTVDGQTLTFTVQDDRIVDVETGSTWWMDGRAVDGPLAGTQLEPVAEAFVSFWFAWPAFYPDTDLWTAS